MAVTQNSYTGNGSTTNYAFTFPYLKSSEVKASLDATVTTAFTLANATTVQFNTAPGNGVKIKIYRETDDAALTATFYAGSAIKSEDLNDNFTQNLYTTQEVNARYLSNLGGTMVGDLIMGEDADITFEGATDNAHETTLTVTDPTADRTITLPNVTGTVITTGDTGTVTATMLAANSVDSSELVDGSVDLSHMSVNSIDSDQYVDGSIDHVHLATDIIDGDNIQDDAVNSEHIASGAVDLDHMSVNSIDSDQYVDGSIDRVHLSADIIDGTKIADDSIDSEHYIAGSIDNEHIADNAIDSEHYADGSIDNAHIADTTIASDKLAGNIAHSKLSNVTDGQILVGNGSNVPTAVAVSGDVTIANTGAVTIANNAVEIGMIGCEQTTISDSDSHLPTSGAVVDYVAAQIAPIGGLEVIADEDNFPATQPASGVVISISDAAGIVVNGSGVSTTARTAGNGSDNVTINNFPSSLYSETLASGVGLMVSSTGSSNTYNYHKLLAAESDVKQLSDDINDFNARYRVNAGEPGSNNDEGDLVYDTNANKMKVYDNSTSAWKDLTTTGEFKFLFLCPAGGTGAPTINGSIATYDLREGSNSGAVANVSSAAQLIVSINNVIQQPNSGTSAPSSGFALVDANTIVFSANVANGASVFVIQMGSAVSVPTPGDNTVTAAKIGSGAVIAAKIGTGAVETAKLAADAVDGTKLADNACDSEHYTDGSIDHVHLAADAVDGDNIADDSINSEHYVDASIDHAHLANDCVDGDNIADDSINSEHYADGSIDHAHLSDDCVDGDNIADNSVGLAAMAGLARGKIIYGNASGDPTALAVGSANQVLTSDGTDISWAASSSGVSSDAQRNTVAGTNAGDSFDGTGATDSTLYGYDAGTAITTGDHNTFIGSYAGDACNTGAENTAVGRSALSTCTSGNSNVAIGKEALEALETGQANTAVGWGAGHAHTTASNNVYVGQQAGYNNTDGNHSVYIGQTCGYAITTGDRNIAIGALTFKETGVDANDNIVLGYNAGTKLTDDDNVIIGTNAHVWGTSCNNNVAIGSDALKGSSGNTTGDNNTCVGTSSGFAITTAGTNTLLGSMAGYAVTTGSTNTIVGREAGKGVTTGQDNVLLGANAANQTNVLTTGEKNICIGNYAHTSAVDGDYQTIIGYNLTGKGDSTSFIYGALYAGNNSSSLSTTSDRRIKKNIVDNNDGLSKINSIRVRNFEYRTFDEITELDNPAAAVVKEEGIQLGVIAQEIMEVLPDVVKQESTGAYSVNPDNLTWYLVNAVKELSAKVTELEAKVNG